MLKWLEEVLGGKPSDQRQPGTEPPAAKTKAAEPPLPLPTFDHHTPDDALAHGIFSRQVILDRSYHPLAYEFSLRAANAQGSTATLKILVGILARFGNGLHSARQFWFRLNDTDLEESLTKTVDPARSVLIVTLTATDNATMNRALELARLLKAEGLNLALAGWQDNEYHHAWLPLCHYVEIRNTSHNPAVLGQWPEKLGALSPHIRLVACDMDSWEELEFCHRQNFQLFRGQLLTHRENWPRQPKLSPERGQLIDLLNRLHLGADLSEITEPLKRSPELSYRLLRYINSAGVGTQARIGSIQQGLMVLGRDKIYRWLTILLFNSGNAKSLDRALLEQALVRARLMELAAADKLAPVQIDELFVVGIFSLLDMLLQLPMSVALEPLKLPPAVESTLLNNHTLESDYAPYLNLAIACEDTDRERLKALAATLAIPLSRINALHLDALIWTQQTLQES